MDGYIKMHLDDVVVYLMDKITRNKLDINKFLRFYDCLPDGADYHNEDDLLGYFKCALLEKIDEDLDSFIEITDYYVYEDDEE